eukprot:COSAG06_NODE_4282_length_4403_cov_3.811338_2_plen_79_part_00
MKVNGVDFRDEMVPVLNVKDERGRVVRVNGVEFGRGVMKRRCDRRAVVLFPQLACVRKENGSFTKTGSGQTRVFQCLR